MRYEVEITVEAEADLDRIRSFYRNEIFNAMELHLQHTPMQESRSRIKRLDRIESPDYRLRVGDYRVYYDVDLASATVIVLRVLSKEESIAYLADLEGGE